MFADGSPSQPFKGLTAPRAASTKIALRRCGRVAEGGGLLNRYRFVKTYRGFESLRLRHDQLKTFGKSLNSVSGTRSGICVAPDYGSFTYAAAGCSWR